MGVLAAHSPTRQADKIKVPVFLAAGREDLRAPGEHTERMEKALKAAGVPVESLYYDGEGHGAYGGTSACVDAAVRAFLLDGTVPAAGTTCT